MSNVETFWVCVGFMNAEGACSVPTSTLPRPKHTRLQAGFATPQNKFVALTAYVLHYRLRNKAPTHEVLLEVENVFGKSFNGYDMDPLPSDKVLRWRKNVQFARQYMVNNGLMLRYPRGVWELTHAGIEYAKSLETDDLK
jgi:Mrr N-terminal domain